MNNRGARRSPLDKSAAQTEARVERARALKLGAGATSHTQSASAPDRALTIREKIARWLEEKL